jgi:hypothetical protein
LVAVEKYTVLAKQRPRRFRGGDCLANAGDDVDGHSKTLSDGDKRKARKTPAGSSAQLGNMGMSEQSI